MTLVAATQAATEATLERAAGYDALAAALRAALAACRAAKGARRSREIEEERIERDVIQGTLWFPFAGKPFVGTDYLWRR